MTTVSVTKVVEFHAAHVLSWHPGLCSRLHGHTYKLEVSVAGPLNDHGIVADFADIREVIKSHVLDRLDHRMLNDIIDNPTAENVAVTVWCWLHDAGLATSQVRLWETSTAYVTVDATSFRDDEIAPGRAHGPS
ncbi:6-carboxytetrahydropterin synthase QueD [Jatrophihabitans lederbergiae]|uniref:6-carboxy-5,6,7,8-tetrahydropterin synthase n=1 Tax=Jatrophihabitans lederbergiae TaxID=3075547 RepID=A0ABU2JEJ2_9ACTN|nr:6-carboxytetrahydropterin synthase QueD [Jatrophihabitans sp. DSM 44399]MDT0263414.1 6-carboxytetrahydropterin synthase QueD [Jatrophihabitans sp. DSM 44399]